MPVEPSSCVSTSPDCVTTVVTPVVNNTREETVVLRQSLDLHSDVSASDCKTATARNEELNASHDQNASRLPRTPKSSSVRQIAKGSPRSAATPAWKFPLKKSTEKLDWESPDQATHLKKPFRLKRSVTHKNHLLGSSRYVPRDRALSPPEIVALTATSKLLTETPPIQNYCVEKPNFVPSNCIQYPFLAFLSSSSLDCISESDNNHVTPKLTKGLPSTPRLEPKRKTVSFSSSVSPMAEKSVLSHNNRCSGKNENILGILKSPARTSSSVAGKESRVSGSKASRVRTLSQKSKYRSTAPESAREVASPAASRKFDVNDWQRIFLDCQKSPERSDCSDFSDEIGPGTFWRHFGRLYRDRRRLSLSCSAPVDEPDSSDCERGSFHVQLTVAKTYSRQKNVTPLRANKPILATPESSQTPVSKSSVRLRTATRHVVDEGNPLAQKEIEETMCRTPPPGELNVTPASQVSRCRRLSVTGLPSASRQNNFANKLREIRSDVSLLDASELGSLGIGYTCKKGLKPESPNQDDFFIIRMEHWALYGVFDGHGPQGHNVSNYVQKMLPSLIRNDPCFKKAPKLALSNAFRKVHSMLEAAGSAHNSLDPTMSGCTASVVLHQYQEQKLYVAHVGDSRCVLGRRSGNAVTAADLTLDHKPNNKREMERIAASGGEVLRLEGDVPYRVFIRGRLYPGLAMSRAIGDTVAAEAGVICDPDVAEYCLDSKRDLFLALCSDGVWEFLKSQEVVDIIHSNGREAVQRSADMLAEESWARWINEGDVVDDITAQIVYFDVPASSQ